jgi:ABC-type antimicrobial peptide transport system permease subunit
VNQRTSEFGVRAALGATKMAITADVLRRGMGLSSSGIVIGLGAAALLARLLRSFLFEVAPLDPITFVAGALLYLVVAAVACIVPARRASRVDPATALRA